MEDKPQTIQPVSDDQELAKVLAGMSDDFKIEDSAEATLPDEKTETAIADVPINTSDSPKEESTLPEPNTLNSDFASSSQTSTPIINNLPNVLNMPEVKSIATETTAIETAPLADGNLESIKKDALLELRPLIDKLDLSPEEKFDICLLLLRSTDDKTLIEPAHNAARDIADETKRAQALLDVIKEIDYLSGPAQPAA